MKLLVGLGNPGEKYKGNRHNVGYMVLDEIASRVGSARWIVDRKVHNTQYTKHQTLILAKPQTMMNSSGKAVKKLVAHYKIKMPNLWVIHDDLDIQLGSYKVQKGKGPREHKGVRSIEKELGTKAFWRVRVGIENRPGKIQNPNDKIQKNSQNTKHQSPITSHLRGEEYVLRDFTDEEMVVIRRVIGRIYKDLVDRLTIH